jgi:hypothetical protein
MHSSTISVDVEVSVAEVLGELSNEDLIQEMEDRNIDGAIDGADELLRCLKRGDITEAVVFLERMLHPKWRSTKLAEAAFAQLKLGETP